MSYFKGMNHNLGGENSCLSSRSQPSSDSNRNASKSGWMKSDNNHHSKPSCVPSARVTLFCCAINREYFRAHWYPAVNVALNGAGYRTWRSHRRVLVTQHFLLHEESYQRVERAALKEVCDTQPWLLRVQAGDTNTYILIPLLHFCKPTANRDSLEPNNYTKVKNEASRDAQGQSLRELKWWKQSHFMVKLIRYFKHVIIISPPLFFIAGTFNKARCNARPISALKASRLAFTQEAPQLTSWSRVIRGTKRYAEYISYVVCLAWEVSKPKFSSELNRKEGAQLT